MTRLLAILALVAGGGCVDETISGYTGDDTVWKLTELDGQPFTAAATITFPEEGTVRGNGPCNTFFARQSVPLPWIKIEALGSTKRACPDLPQEAAYFSALQRMTLAEVAGDTLLLTDGDTGSEMVFRALPASGG